MNDPTIQLVLRVVHILAGVFWVGAAVMIAWFIRPSQRALGAEGDRFVRRLFGPGRLPVFLGVSVALTLVTGVVMYWRFATAGGSAWIGSTRGASLTAGAALALLAVLVGFGNGVTNGIRLARLRKSLEDGSGPADDGRTREVMRLNRRMAIANHVIAILLVGAVVAMAAAGHL